MKKLDLPHMLKAMPGCQDPQGTGGVPPETPCLDKQWLDNLLDLRAERLSVEDFVLLTKALL